MTSNLIDNVKEVMRKRYIVSLIIISIIIAIIPRKDVQGTELPQSIIEKREAIESARKEQDKLKNSVSDIQKMVNELEDSKKDLENYVSNLDAKLGDIQTKLDELVKLIGIKEKEIEETKANLEEAIRLEEEQHEAMKERIRFLYEKGQTFYLEILVTSKSFGELLNKSQYVDSLMLYDYDMLNEYIMTREMVELTKMQLEEEEAVLQEARDIAKKEEENISVLINEKHEQISIYKADIGDKNAAIQEYKAEMAANDAVIKALEKAVAEEIARLSAENKVSITYDGGMFKWPCPSYTRLSDDYGVRMHPILGVEQFHNGIDLAASSGAAILAAYDGEVVGADYSGSMGNYIIINHGNSLYTIYMHCSVLNVSKGAYVTKGQTIAGVGTTGRSTGNHLHFGVRLNGSYVSPWNYLSQ